jgi:hypothetical protein
MLLELLCRQFLSKPTLALTPITTCGATSNVSTGAAITSATGTAGFSSICTPPRLTAVIAAVATTASNAGAVATAPSDATVATTAPASAASTAIPSIAVVAPPAPAAGVPTTPSNR